MYSLIESFISSSAFCTTNLNSQHTISVPLKLEKSANGTHQLSVLDLFSGPGGMSQGIMNARSHDLRFQVVAANDNNEAVMSTYTHNHPDVEFTLGSITNEDVKKKITSSIRRTTGRSTVDLVVGGPPCKGFSLENKMTRNMDNPMNHLVIHYLEMVKRIKPTAFVMENVPGILAMNKGKIIAFLIESLRNLGYHNTTAWLLNAADFGVPQMRQRAFMVGSRSKMPIKKPESTHGDIPSLLPYTTLTDVLSDLPKIRAGKTESNTTTYLHKSKNSFQRRIRVGSRRILNHTVTRNSDIVISRIKSVPPGGNWSDIPIKLMRIDGKYSKLDAHSMIYKRLRMDRPSITITNFRKAMIIHPTQDRLLSVREAARIQTFPDRFEFMGGISNMQQQVSDAVPVGLAKKVGDMILSHLHNTMMVPVIR